MSNDNLQDISSILKEIPLLSASHVKISDAVSLSKKLEEIKKGGADKLQVITDFDATITKHHVNGERTPSSFGILSLCKSTPSEFIKKNRALAERYYPIEKDPKLSKEDKIPHMKEWYALSQKMFNGLPFVPAEVDDVVAGPLVAVRDGTEQLFSLIAERKIPTLVLSAGLGDVIKTALSNIGLEESDILHIVSNFFQFEGDLVSGFGCHENGQFIHPFNKNVLGCTQYFQKVGNCRRNVILMGDTIGDSNMAEGVPNLENVLKIGFLYGTAQHVEDSMAQYLDHFDVVLIDDQTMDIPVAILQLLLN